MKHYFQNIMPDSLTGAIFAVEGIKDGVVVLNGPTGCKLYHSAISDYQYPRQLSFDPLNYPEEFYFGQPRVPCTYLDGYDYVYGSSEKLEKLLKDIKKKSPNLIAVINSPGAALIGDDLNRFIQREVDDTLCFSIESTGFSGSYSEGFQNGVIKVLESLYPISRKYKCQNTVNLIGISLYDKYCEGNILEIKRLLELCGIDVISTLCARNDLNTLKDVPRAMYNIVINPENGVDIADWLYDRYDTPYMILKDGMPVGFDATEKFIENICTEFNKDGSKAIEDVEKARARSYLHISRLNSLTGLPKGATFAIGAQGSMAYALAKWLYTYLGMIPVSIEVLESNYTKFEDKLSNFLEGIGFEEALKTSIQLSKADIIFADANTIAQSRLENNSFAGIEISLPSLGYIDVVPKTFFGTSGALMLVEQVLNGLRF